ncbi:hypothetical protein [Niallia sp. 03190]|uniref:hypothetical protein n=1 Tax=Niallia sp. 03190 TaxID=3458061 RepID=UPI0040444E47
MDFIMSIATLGFLITLVYGIVLKVRRKPAKKIFLSSLTCLGIMFISSFFVDGEKPKEKVEPVSKEANATKEEKKEITNKQVLNEIKVGMDYPEEYNKAKKKLNITPEKNISIGNGNVGSVIKTKEGYIVANIVAENIDISDAKIAEINTFKNMEEVKKYESDMRTATEKEDDKPSFDFTWDQFKNDWITIVPNIKGSKIANFTDEDPTNQKDNIALSAKITDYLQVLGDLEPKTNKVRYISIMGQPTNDNGKNTDIILAFGNLIAVSNPKLSAEERGNILMKKLKFDSGDFSNLDETYEYNGVIYKASNMAGILTVSISPSE